MPRYQPCENPRGADNEQGSPLTETDLAWLAGHFDGDGWIGIVRQKRTTTKYLRYTAAAMIATTSDRIRDKILYTLDGLEVVWFCNETPEKHVVGPDRDSWHRRKWDISVRSNKQAKAFLTLILPYLVEKKPQAELALEYVEWRSSLPRNPGRYGDEISMAIQRRAEETLRLMREDRNRHDPSTTTRLAPPPNYLLAAAGDDIV